MSWFRSYNYVIVLAVVDENIIGEKNAILVVIFDTSYIF